jgi:hypothetical protein
VPVEVLLGSEPVPATLTVDVLGLNGFTSLRTDLVPVSYASLDNEVLPTDVAVLRDAVRASSFIALTRAEGPCSVASKARIEYLAASGAFTGDVHGPVGAVTKSGTESGGVALDEEVPAVLAGDLGHEPILVDVYDITVETEHAFYAQGILVHNCSVCAYAEDNNSYPLAECPQPPLHVRCRCAVSPSDFQPTVTALRLVTPYDISQELEAS